MDALIKFITIPASRDGFLESVYETCLMIELTKARLEAKAQHPSTVYYDGEVAGEYVADVFFEETIIGIEACSSSGPGA